MKKLIATDILDFIDLFNYEQPILTQRLHSSETDPPILIERFIRDLMRNDLSCLFLVIMAPQLTVSQLTPLNSIARKTDRFQWSGYETGGKTTDLIAYYQLRLPTK